MSERLPGFKGDYLWEFEIAERQLIALAEAFPAERYAWRSAETARSVSEVLVHVAGANLMLLGVTGIEAAPDLYGKLEAETLSRMMVMIPKNESLEKTITDKTAVIALLKRSFDALRAAFTQATDAELDRIETFFGGQATIRSAYLRALAHMHEHMGQLIAYTRSMGLPAPWTAERQELRRKMMERRSAASTNVD
jgi:uncharacterized damage-inducible protein DinB